MKTLLKWSALGFIAMTVCPGGLACMPVSGKYWQFIKAPLKGRGT